MRIKTDFVTNSSSTNFILGEPESNDTVDTIYNFLRMTISEIYFIIDNVKNEIKNNELYKEFNVYYDELGGFLYKSYSQSTIINDLFLKYYNNSFFSVYCQKFNIDFIDFLKIELVESTLDFEYILNNVTYNQYKEYSTGIELLDLSEVKDKDDLKFYLKEVGYSYFVENENINNYKDFFNKVELMDIIDIKSYLKKLGSVFVISKNDELRQLEFILQSFFSSR